VVVLAIRCGRSVPKTYIQASKKVHAGGCLNEVISVDRYSARVLDPDVSWYVQCAAQRWNSLGGIMFDSWFMRRLAVGISIAVLMFLVRYVMYGVGF
jgi:hypothetical protein